MIKDKYPLLFFCCCFFVVFFCLSSIRLTRSVMFKDFIAIHEEWCNKVLTRKDIILFYHSCTTQNAFILTDSIQIIFLCICSVHKQIYKKCCCFFNRIRFKDILPHYINQM